MDKDKIENIINPFLKSTMIKKGELKESQANKYVLYYIFYKEDPVYVGITNNFNIRKSQHFSSIYREKENDKKLYKHMSENNIKDYSMYIVRETQSARDISGLETIYISELKKTGYAQTNVAKGGGYKLPENVAKINVEEFMNFFYYIEKVSINGCNIDMPLLEKGLEKLDWDLMYSIENCWVTTASDEHEKYLKKWHKKNKNSKKEPMDFDKFFNTEIHYQEMCPQQFVASVLDGSIMLEETKNRNIREVFNVLNYLEQTDDPIEVYCGLKSLFGADYEDEILYIIDDYMYKNYDIVEKITEIN